MSIALANMLTGANLKQILGAFSCHFQMSPINSLILRVGFDFLFFIIFFIFFCLNVPKLALANTLKHRVLKTPIRHFKKWHV